MESDGGKAPRVILTCPLGVKQSLISATDQVGWRFYTLRKRRNTDTGRDGQLIHAKGADSLEETLGECKRFCATGANDKHRKFLAAVSRHSVGWAELLLKAYAQSLKHSIAMLMPMRVIVHLEVVNIE